MNCYLNAILLIWHQILNWSKGDWEDIGNSLSFMLKNLSGMVDSFNQSNLRPEWTNARWVPQICMGTGRKFNKKKVPGFLWQLKLERGKRNSKLKKEKNIKYSGRSRMVHKGKENHSRDLKGSKRCSLFSPFPFFSSFLLLGRQTFDRKAHQMSEQNIYILWSWGGHVLWYCWPVAPFLSPEVDREPVIESSSPWMSYLSYSLALFSAHHFSASCSLKCFRLQMEVCSMVDP